MNIKPINFNMQHCKNNKDKYNELVSVYGTINKDGRDIFDFIHENDNFRDLDKLLSDALQSCR